MATLPTITGSFVKSYDREYPYTGSTNAQHFGYSSYGHRAVSIFKFTMPSYSGTPDSLEITLKVVRGTAYPTNKTSRWNITLDPNDAGYSSTLGSCSNPLANGLYTNYYNGYTLTFPSTGTSTITTTESTFKVTYTSLSNSMYESGNVFYAYLYSDTGSHDMIKCNTITATLTYTPESTAATTNTELRVGRSSSTTAPSTMSNSSTNLTYNYNYLHYKISGLQNAANTYDGFYIYDWSNISSYFTQGMTWSEMTNKDSYLGKTTSTSTGKTVSGYILAPKMDGELRVAKTRSIVCLAVTSGRAWQIGGDTANSIPQKCTVSLTSDNFIKSNITVTRTASTATTATYLITVNKNTNGYIDSVSYNLSHLRSESGTNTAPTVNGSVTFSDSSSSQTKTLTVTGLTAGTSNTIYFNVHCDQSFSMYKYYGHSYDSFITDLADSDPSTPTDAGYTGSAGYTLIGPWTVKLHASTNTLHNLDGYIYYTTSSSLPTSTPSTRIDLQGGTSGNSGQISITSSKTYYFYVRSSVSKKFYKIASTTVTPDASSYSCTISVSNIGTTTANFSHSTLSSTTNLNSKWYLTTRHTAATIAGNVFNADVGNGNRNNAISGINLTPAVTQTVYAYVYSSASNYYHLVDSIEVTTSASSYSGKVLTTGITGTSATLCLFAISPTANMENKYYVTTTNYGATTTTIPGSSINFKTSTTLNNLIPGQSYTYYIYVKNTSNNTFYLVST